MVFTNVAINSNDEIVVQTSTDSVLYVRQRDFNYSYTPGGFKIHEMSDAGVDALHELLDAKGL